MKIGILNAFPPDWDSIDLGCSPTELYIRFLEQVQPSFTYQGYDVANGQFPASVTDCDAYLITGSPRGVYDPDAWIAELMAFIRAAYRAKRKLVGICFGHQVLAHALGGRCEKSEKGWGLGLKPFDIYAQKPWMSTAVRGCALHFVHQDQVVQLPPGAELLGGNDFCPNLFFTLDDRVLGIQGHPEFTAEMMEAIIAARKDVFPLELSHAARRSLQNGSPDNRRLARWVVDFLLA